MKASVLLSLTLVLWWLPASAASELIIGCSTACDGPVKKALNAAASPLKLKLRILNLAKEKKLDWSKLHGVLVPGGADINPMYYLPQVEPDLQEYTRKLDHLVEYTKEGETRDPFEYALLQEYYRRPDLEKFPLLGICRGMQMMAVALGMPLYVDIKAELGLKNRRSLYDKIETQDPGSLLSQIFSNTPFWGYKNHHQGIRVPYYLQNAGRWPHVKITSFSNEGKIAESLELLGRPALGIQFHPEADNNSVRRKIFTWFLKQAAKKI